MSAWLDDELPPAELELLASRLAQAPDLRARVARYALIGSRLRAGRSGDLSGELLALRLGERVRAAIDGPSEPARPAAVRLVGRRTGRWLPYGIAAGGALLAVALVPLLRQANVGAPLSVRTEASAVMPAKLTPVSRSSNRMTSYLVYHGEYSGALSAKVTDSNIIKLRSSGVATSLANGASDR